MLCHASCTRKRSRLDTASHARFAASRIFMLVCCGTSSTFYSARTSTDCAENRSCHVLRSTPHFVTTVSLSGEALCYCRNVLQRPRPLSGGTRDVISGHDHVACRRTCVHLRAEERCLTKTRVRLMLLVCQARPLQPFPCRQTAPAS